MAMSYGLLVGAKPQDGSIRNWVNVAGLPVDAILTDAQAFIYSQLRVREMRWTASVTLAIGDSTAALPADFLDPVSLTAKDGLGHVDLLDDAEVEERRDYNADGSLSQGPVSGAAATGTLIFDAASDAARILTLAYYRRPALLGPSTQTNFLTDRYPHILRAACAMMTADFRHDDANYARYSARAAALIASAQVEGDLSKRGQIFPKGFHRG